MKIQEIMDLGHSQKYEVLVDGAWKPATIHRVTIIEMNPALADRFAMYTYPMRVPSSEVEFSVPTAGRGPVIVKEPEIEARVRLPLGQRVLEVAEIDAHCADAKAPKVCVLSREALDSLRLTAYQGVTERVRADNLKKALDQRVKAHDDFRKRVAGALGFVWFSTTGADDKIPTEEMICQKAGSLRPPVFFGRGPGDYDKEITELKKKLAVAESERNEIRETSRTVIQEYRDKLTAAQKRIHMISEALK